MVSLGTPLSPSATRVLLLGSGELAKEVLIALQRLGVETIAADRYADAPGHQVAHHARTLTMSDPEQLRASSRPSAPTSSSPRSRRSRRRRWWSSRPRACASSPPPGPRALTMDREGIRRLAAETLGLPTSPYRFCDSLDELRAGADAVGFPCVVKPVMSSSGKGQSTVRTPDDVEAAWQYAMAGSRVAGTRVIVEGFVDFDYEITLLTVRSRRGDETVTGFCAPIGHRQESGDYVESWQPQAMSQLALQRAQQIAAAVTADLGGLGLFGVELFVRGDDVWFSEVSPRPHDTGMVTMATQWQDEFELHARALLGLPVDTALRNPGASAVVYGGVEATGITFDGVDEALALPGVQLRLFGKPESFTRRRMGVALARGEDVDTARATAREAAGRVRPRA